MKSNTKRGNEHGNSFPHSKEYRKTYKIKTMDKFVLPLFCSSKIESFHLIYMEQIKA